MPANVGRKPQVTTKRTEAPKPPPATKQAATMLKKLQDAEHPGHMVAAAKEAMDFLMSPAAKSLTVQQARPLHMYLGEMLTSLDDVAGWRPTAPTSGPAAPLIEMLGSDHPGHISNGVQDTLAFLQTPAAKRLDSTARNELFKALGAAQASLKFLEEGAR